MVCALNDFSMACAKEELEQMKIICDCCGISVLPVFYSTELRLHIIVSLFLLPALHIMHC